MKLRCAVLLRLGLKGVKIFCNVSKVCMHACWSNWHPNLWSNLNSKKLLERETPSCGFNRVGLKGGQNSLKRRESWRACLSIQYASDIWPGLNSKNLVKDETAECSFLRVWLKDGENSSQHRESCMHSYFPNTDLNLRLNFKFEKLVKRETSLCGFAKVGLKGGEDILECLKSLHARLVIKLASKFMIKFKF